MPTLRARAYVRTGMTALPLGRKRLPWHPHEAPVEALPQGMPSVWSASLIKGSSQLAEGILPTDKDDDLNPSKPGRDPLDLLQGKVQKLTADNLAQQGHLKISAPAIQHKLEELVQTVRARRNGGLESALRIVNTGRGRGHTCARRKAISPPCSLMGRGFLTGASPRTTSAPPGCGGL